MVETITAAIVLGCAAYCLWVRRYTFTLPWERAMTICILQIMVASVLMNPAADDMDRWLARLTGQWNLADWLGHMSYLSALVAFVFHLNMRMFQRRTPSRVIGRRMRCSLATAAPVTLISLWHSPNADTEGAILLGTDSDKWLKYYWLTIGAVLLYMLAHAAQLALILRSDIRSRRHADFYLVGITAATLVVVVQTLDAFSEHSYLLDFLSTYLLWPSIGIAECLFCLPAAFSWRTKCRHQHRQLL